MADAMTESAVVEQVVTNATTATSATTTQLQHGLHGAIQQQHPLVAPQQPAAVMAGSYSPATYPNVFYTPQSGAVQFMQPPQPGLQPQTQVSQQNFDCNVSHDHFILTCFTRPSRERYSLCNHLNPVYNHKHK